MGQRARMEDRALRAQSHAAQGRESLPRARRPAAVRRPDARRLAVASAEPARRRARRFSIRVRPTGRRGTSCADFSSCRRTSTKRSRPTSSVPRGGSGAGVHGIRQPDADRGEPASARHHRDVRGGGANRRLPRDRPESMIDRPSTDRILFVRRTPHKPGVSSMRGRRPPCRRGHHPHDLARRRAVGSGAARLGSIRVVRRTAAPRRRADADCGARAVTAATLASRITEVLTNPRMKQAAMAMSARMQADNGPDGRRSDRADRLHPALIGLCGPLRPLSLLALG